MHPTEFSMIADSKLSQLHAMVNEGYTSDKTLPGFYAHVIEGGYRPRLRKDKFVRRILNEDKSVPPDTAIVGLKHSIA